MDAVSIASDIATYLKSLDVIASAEPDEAEPYTLDVMTQGGVRYIVSVGRMDVTTESAAPEG